MDEKAVQMLEAHPNKVKTGSRVGGKTKKPWNSVTTRREAALSKLRKMGICVEKDSVSTPFTSEQCIYL